MQSIYYIFLIFLCAGCFSQPEKPAQHQSSTGWKLSWSDEFDYNGLPDSSKWGYDVGGHGWGNNELQYYTKASAANAEVSNGTLKLRALQQKMKGKDYTSARLVTRDKASFTYGKIEMRAKLPPGRGLWPAFWMLGSNVNTVDWPECGEIDIMEHVGFEKDSIFGTIHSKSYNHIIGTQKTRKTFISDPYNAWHVYSVDWTPEYMDFYVDNILFNHVENEHKTVAEWPFDLPFYMILNIAVGGNLGGKHGVDNTAFPAVMEVDYVRVYTAGKK
jgi:beta-glucanase (GH16 family)